MGFRACGFIRVHRFIGFKVLGFKGSFWVFRVSGLWSCRALGSRAYRAWGFNFRLLGFWGSGFRHLGKEPTRPTVCSINPCYEDLARKVEVGKLELS